MAIAIAVIPFFRLVETYFSIRVLLLPIDTNFLCNENHFIPNNENHFQSKENN